VVGQQRAVVTDQHQPAGVLPQPGGEVLEPARVEMVGRFVEQQQVVPGAQQAGQPDAVALPDRQGAERTGTVGDRAERGERHVHPAVGVPGVQGLRCREHLGVGLLGARTFLPQLRDRGVEAPEHGAHAGELDVDEIADRRVACGPEHRCRAVGPDGDFLVGDADGADPAYGPGVGWQDAGEHLQQRGLATAVLPDDAEPVACGHGEVDAGQDGTAAAGDVHVGHREVGPRAGR
jgi:hypothetical protein